MNIYQPPNVLHGNANTIVLIILIWKQMVWGQLVSEFTLLVFGTMLLASVQFLVMLLVFCYLSVHASEALIWGRMIFSLQLVFPKPSFLIFQNAELFYVNDFENRNVGCFFR